MIWAAVTYPSKFQYMLNLIQTYPIRYKFDQTDKEVFLSLIPELNSTQDIDKYADFIVTAISTAVDKTIPTFKRGYP